MTSDNNDHLAATTIIENSNINTNSNSNNENMLNKLGTATESIAQLSQVKWQPSNMQIYSQIVISFLFFMALFIYFNNNLRKMSRHLQSVSPTSFRNIIVRINSSIHAIITTVAAIYLILTDSQLNSSNLFYTSFPINLTQNLVLGYMLYDIVLMLYYTDIFELSSIAHHIVVIIAYYSGSVTSLFALTCIFRLVSEASTPLINLRWILLELKQTKTKLYLYNGLAVVVLFGLVRILAILPHWYIIYSYMRTNEFYEIHLIFKLIGILCGLPLDILNTYWFMKIIKNARKHLKLTSIDKN